MPLLNDVTSESLIPQNFTSSFSLSLSFSSPLSLHLPHLFISHSLSAHIFISLIYSSPQLITPLIFYLNPVLKFYFSPLVILLRFMIQRCNLFPSLLLDWICGFMFVFFIRFVGSKPWIVVFFFFFFFLPWLFNWICVFSFSVIVIVPPNILY